MMEEEVNVVREDKRDLGVLVDIGRQKKSHRGKETWKGVGGWKGWMVGT